jgi:hypothetical protein
VIQDAASHDAAADHDDLVPILHAGTAFDQGIERDGVYASSEPLK